MSTDPHHHHDHGPGPGELRPAPLGTVDPAQESLVAALRASFNILRVLMLVLVVLYVFSGVFRVDPDQQGLVSRLGRLRERADGGYVFGPGWHATLPDPFDTKYRLTGQIIPQRVTTFMFSHPEAETARDLATIVVQARDIEPGRDGAMLSGDRNLSHGRWEVQYRIEDAARFVQNVAEKPEAFHPLLQRLTETAVLREVAGRTVEEVTRHALEAVSDGVQQRVQKALDELNTGVRVVRVVGQTIEPGAVREAFLDVINAESQKQAVIDEARGQRTRVLSEAAGPAEIHEPLLALIHQYGAAQLTGAAAAELERLRGAIDAALEEAERREAGKVALTLRTARTQASALNESLRREYDRFTKWLEQRKLLPEVTLLRLWNEMRAEILGNRQNEVVLVPGGGDEIEILVNRDPERLKELEEEQLKARREGRSP